MYINSCKSAHKFICIKDFKQTVFFIDNDHKIQYKNDKIRHTIYFNILQLTPFSLSFTIPFLRLKTFRKWKFSSIFYVLYTNIIVYYRSNTQ